MNQRLRKRRRDINWLWVAGAATVVYVVGAGSVLGWSTIWNFIATDDELNPIGDLVAGMFAPLAFMWLVAAVLTQR